MLSNPDLCTYTDVIHSSIYKTTDVVIVFVAAGFAAFGSKTSSNNIDYIYRFID